MEGNALIFVVISILLYGFTDNIFLLEDIIHEINYTDHKVSFGYYIGSTIGLSLLLIIPTIITTWIPIIGQQNSEYIAYFKSNFTRIFIYNYIFQLCLFFATDYFKALNHYNRKSALEALTVYVFLIVILTIIYFLIRFGGSVIKVFASQKQKSELDVKESKTLDISAALSKLEEINRAFKAGLIDEETFLKIKIKIQEQIHKEL